jgi:hypothetical protein
MKRILIFIVATFALCLGALGQNIPVPGGGRGLRAGSGTPSNGNVPTWNSSTLNWDYITPAGGGGGSAPTGTMVSSGTWAAGDLAEAADGTGTNFVKRSSSGSGNVARVTSPAFITPTLGAATATTVNKLTITAPATGATLAIADGKTATINNSVTLAGTDSTTITFQGTDTYVGRTTTDTLTNKRITRRSVALTDAATVTPNSDTTDMGTLATLSQATQFLNPTGTPTDGQRLEIRIKSTVARTLTYDTQYKASDDLALPTLTTANKTDRMVYEWDGTDSKWVIIGRSLGGNP